MSTTTCGLPAFTGDRSQGLQDKQKNTAQPGSCYGNSNFINLVKITAWQMEYAGIHVHSNRIQIHMHHTEKMHRPATKEHANPCDKMINSNNQSSRLTLITNVD